MRPSSAYGGRSAGAQAGTPEAMISVIIPAYNEERLLGRTLYRAKTSALATGRPYELVVVDDGSTDGTVRVAESAGARVVKVELRHIAAARNAGARSSRGDVLVFLDADTLLPALTLRAAIAAVEQGASGGGAVVEFDGDMGMVGRLCVVLWNVLSRQFHWAAGCFMFAHREAFDAIGGFDERYYISEEIHFSAALGKLGRFAILRESVTTSSRKIRMHPTWTLLWSAIRLLLAGPKAYQSREGLWLWYDGKREESDP